MDNNDILRAKLWAKWKLEILWNYENITIELNDSKCDDTIIKVA